MEEQMQYFLQIEDSSFEEDPEFAFVVYNIIRKKEVSRTLRFRVPVAKYATIVEQMVNLDRKIVMELEEKFRRDPGYAILEDSERNILRIAESISPVAKNIPGSAATRIAMRNEIRALINYRGPPTLFITINPSDIHNPIVSVLANRCTTAESMMAALGQTSRQRVLAGAKRPAASAMFFDAIMDAFIKIILAYDKTGKSRGVYGVCDAYYGTVEVQGRGSLHCHMLVWLQGHLPPESLKEAVLGDVQYRSKLVGWLDSIMQSNFLSTIAVSSGGEGSTISRVGLGETSVHAVSELVEGLSDPHPGCVIEPQISQLPPSEFWKEYPIFVNELLLRYNWHWHCATCWKYLRRGELRSPENCRFGLDGTTIPETSIEEGTGRVVVSRIQPMMTSYTDIVMFLLKCNMDVKFIGSGNEAKALMYYITDYITKTPLPIHQGLAALSYAIHQTSTRIPDLQSSASVEQLQSAITIAVNSMLGHTEFSKTQVLHQLLGGKESITNEDFHNVNWGEIRKFVQTSWDGAETMENGETVNSPISPVKPLMNTQHDLNSAATSIYITPNNGEIVISNQRLDYIHRPEHYSLLGLYNYFSITRKYRMQEDEYGQILAKGQHRFSSNHHPQYQTHAVSLRKHPVIPVLLGPNLARSTSTDAEKEKWAMDTLILFKPWRSPCDLKQPSETWAAAMSRFEAEVSSEDRQRIAHMSVLAEGREARSQYPRHARTRRQFDVGPVMDLMDEDSHTPEVSSTHEQNVFYAGFAQPPIAKHNHDQATLLKQDTENEEQILDMDTIAAFDKCYRVHSNTNEHDRAPVDDTIQANPELLAIAQLQYDKLIGIGSDDDDSSGDKEPNEDNSHDNDSAARIDFGSEGSTSATLSQRPCQHEEATVAITTLKDGTLGIGKGNYQGSEGGPEDQDSREALVRSIANEKGISNNPEQLQAFRIVAEHVLSGGLQLLLYVGGMGGTGKSYVVNAITELFERLGRRHELAIGAPTGIAATLVGGSTLHSLILANPSQKMHRSEHLAKIWRPIKYMIVDEVSMVGAQFLALMSSRIRIGKADIPFASALPFGGVNIIFTGDFCQLTPPKQKSVFAHELVHSPSFAESRNIEGISNLAGVYLWRQVQTVVLLQKNHRQSIDPTYARVLEVIRKGAAGRSEGNSLRVDNMSIVTYLRQRDLQHVRHHSPNTLELFKDAPVVVGSKRLRDLLNVRLIRSNAAHLGKEVWLYHSRDIVQRREVSNGWIRNYLWNLPSRRTRDTFGILPLFVGMKVMITENISITHRAVNGAEGTVTKICYSEGQDGIRYAEVVYVHIPKSGLRVSGLAKDVVPIVPTSTSIQHILTIGSYQMKSFTRRQCPLVPAYCYTDYKSQGRSLEKVVVDLASARNQGVYVMLSRVKSLQGLLILRWFPEAKVLRDLSGELREELSRIEKLSRATAARIPVR
ncbi:hypothetical protein MD484_g4202, partial [Candolleomyces efflorescens]